MFCPADVFMLQEHWLTPDNLSKFDRFLLIFFHLDVHAMSRSMLRGRPFGGVITVTGK